MADGGAVALRFVLISCFLSLPDHAPLASYRLGNSARVVRCGRWDSSVRLVIYGRALRAVKEVVVKSRRNPDEFALYSLRIGGATASATGGDTSERVMQREGRWRSDAYKTYTRNIIEVARRVSGKPGVASGGKERQPGEGTVWGRKRQPAPDNSSPNDLEVGGLEWYSTIRRLGHLNN